MRFHIILIFFLICGAVSCAHPDAPSPDHRDETEKQPALIRFYRGPLNRLSAVRDGQCPMYPTCSEYSRQAINAYGPVMGAVMSIERLMRCGRDELRLSPKILDNGEFRCFDTVENNSFWWNHHPASRIPDFRELQESGAKRPISGNDP